MSEFPGSIAYFARAESRLFHLSVIKELKAKFGCRIHLYCNGVEQVAFYRKRPESEFLDSIEDAGFLLQAATEQPGDPAETLKTAARLEEKIGRPYSRLTSANRHLGRGFSPAGFYHPRSFTSKNATPLSIANGYNKVLSFFFDSFEAKQIDLAINPYKEAAVVCNAVGIPYRAMAGSRYKNLHYWAWNEHYENPMFAERYAELKRQGTTPELDLQRPYDAHMANRTDFFKQRSLTSAIKKSGYRAAQFAYWKIRGYEKGRKGYLPQDVVSLPFRSYREFKRLSQLSKTTLADLKDQPFVFFPLHIEPEAALQIISPEYLYQQAAITSLARELPAGVVLAVKEAFNMIGRRPPRFYEQLLEHKNVVILRTDQMGLDCSRQSLGIGTISGTAGLEATVSGRPVLSFGRHNMYNFLDSVSVITDETQIYPALKSLCARDYDSEAIRTEGRRFLDALAAESFDMGRFDYRDMNSYDQENVDSCVEKLVESVRSKLPAPLPY